VQGVGSSPQDQGRAACRGRVGNLPPEHVSPAVGEEKLAPLLQRLDLRRWAVLILGDHGESWTPEEPYHGQALRKTAAGDDPAAPPPMARIAGNYKPGIQRAAG
jgi:hypothetical protein